MSRHFARRFNWPPYLGSLVLGNPASARMKSFNPSIFSCTLNWRLTPRINGIPHFLLNCHENYWDSPISSLTGSWDSPILTRGLWDSPCPFPPFSEGFFYPSGYLFWSLWHSKALFIVSTSAIPRRISTFLFNGIPISEEFANHSYSEELFQSFPNELTPMLTRVSEYPFLRK